MTMLMKASHHRLAWQRLASAAAYASSTTPTSATSALLARDDNSPPPLFFSVPSFTMTATRSYRGDSGDAIVHDGTLDPQEEALLRVARPKADAIFERHIRLPTSTSSSSSSSQTEADQVDDDVMATRQKRLIYRSKQRGWLEVDLLLGTWASQNVPHLNADDLDQFERFVNQETIDIYNIITLRVPVPEELKGSDTDSEGTKMSVVERIQKWARSHPLGKADPESYKTAKTEHQLI